jgi:hypothetical protein
MTLDRDSRMRYPSGMELCVTDIVRDEGSIVVLQGIATDGTDRVVNFAADHRPAQDIMDAIASGNDVYVEVEPWQIVGA